MKFRNILALNRKYSKQDGYGYILWKSDKTPSKLLHNIIQLSLVQTTIKWHEWTILESLIRVVWTWSCCMLVPQSSLCTSISRVLGDLLHSEHSQYFVNPITSPRFQCQCSNVFCFQDLKNQILTTNLWVETVSCFIIISSHHSSRVQRK